MYMHIDLSTSIDLSVGNVCLCVCLSLALCYMHVCLCVPHPPHPPLTRPRSGNFHSNSLVDGLVAHRDDAAMHHSQWRPLLQHQVLRRE